MKVERLIDGEWSIPSSLFYAFLPRSFFMISSVDCVADRLFYQVAGYPGGAAGVVVAAADVVVADAVVLFADGVDAFFSFQLFPGCVS